MLDELDTGPGAKGEGDEFWDGCGSDVGQGGATIEPKSRDAGCGDPEPRYETLTPRSFTILSKMFEWLSQYSNVTTRFCLYARASSTSMIHLSGEPSFVVVSTSSCFERLTAEFIMGGPFCQS